MAKPRDENRFISAFRRLLLPTVVITGVGSLWVMAWANTLVAKVDKGTFPAIPIPKSVFENESSTEIPSEDGSKPEYTSLNLID